MMLMFVNSITGSKITQQKQIYSSFPSLLSLSLQNLFLLLIANTIITAMPPFF